MQRIPTRLVSVDVLRGLVILLLIPDVDGGFSFYAMAQRQPDSALWRTLAHWFTHVQWSGGSVWDLIMPAFVFLVGVAMPLSAAARRARGDTDLEVYGHVLLRAAALLLLAFALRISGDTNTALLWPLLILTVGLPISSWLGAVFPRAPVSMRRRIELGWWLAVLAASAVWVGGHVYDFGQYRFEHILSQLALASVFAALLVGRPLAAQLGAAAAILAAYWCVFAFYPVPAPGFDPSSVGVAPNDEVFVGFFAHWNKNTNVAAAFDVWFVNLLPRAEPFRFDPKGIQTLNFVPTIATMIFGIMAGELLRSARPKNQIRNALLASGAAGVLAGLAVAVWLCPAIKSLWTPSYALVTAGVVTLVLGAIYEVCDVREWRACAFPFVVLGANSLLLYVLASRFRYYFLSLPRKVTGSDWFAGAYAPLLESAVFLLMLFCVALALFRRKVFVRL